MSKLTTLRDGLIDQLKDLYSAENQLLKALPKMARKASNRNLKEAITAHLAETEGQVQRLEKIGTIIKEKLSGKTCKAMQGLIEEGKEVLEEESENKALIDALLIGAAQRVEHYEIAAYGTASAMAREIGERDVVALLEETLDEEDAADEQLSQIAEDEVLSEANNNADDSESEEEEIDANAKPVTAKNVQTKKRSGVAPKLLGALAALLLTSQVNSIALAETASEAAQHEKAAGQYHGDNTGRNTRDRNDARVTADDQKLSGNELQVLAKIRQEIIANKSLSVNGHNVKIVVASNVVTLRGLVNSNAEKAWIEKATSKVASGYKVVNQLEVTPS